MKEAQSGTKTCKRCKSSFATGSNSSSACRFHPTFFVSRRHDDQKRYYELGPDDPPYAAKFWDCCGSEDPEARGSDPFAQCMHSSQRFNDRIDAISGQIMCFEPSRHDFQTFKKSLFPC